ncbi:hypothetical protein [Lelliottia wanjuensis]|uniref:Uncharacterized protein n=1 Tax=Lelliottia wanjuensis TaxID=3050585 RepID=A0AAP4FZ90_9ENTR|nr:MULTISPECIES: hypothetical protein [unclassified Lelliottia]MDK9366438.1 hypothetical protein [Lelliottia sp. V106_12]MDK9618693.1 hypothetical protein [Lelliottia sp. V106_9]
MNTEIKPKIDFSMKGLGLSLEAVDYIGNTYNVGSLSDEEKIMISSDISFIESKIEEFVTNLLRIHCTHPAHRNKAISLEPWRTYIFTGISNGIHSAVTILGADACFFNSKFYDDLVFSNCGYTIHSLPFDHTRDLFSGISIKIKLSKWVDRELMIQVSPKE